MASECTNLRPHSQTAFIVKWAASVIQMLGYAGTGFGWAPWNLYLFLAEEM